MRIKRHILPCVACILLCGTVFAPAACCGPKKAAVAGGGPAAQEGMEQTLPAWSPGELDIHAVATLRGECWLYILPDGTTLCVDCGELPEKGDGSLSHDPYSDRDVVRRLVPRPDGSPKAHAVAAAYMRRFLPAAAADSLDYLLLTHHHNDHMNGIPGLYGLLPFRTLLDRTDSAAIAQEAEKNRNAARYLKFLRRKKLAPVVFEPGSSAQIRARHDGPVWTLTALAASGIVWTPEGMKNVYEGKKMSENGASCCFLLRYGDFDWLATGDAGDPNSRTLWPVAQTVGRKIEAMKVPHHYAWRTFSARLIDLLQPQVMVSESFWSHQPWKTEWEQLRTVRYDQDRPKDLFLTSPYTVPDGTDNALGPEDLSRLAGYGGHVVLRVAPGGKTFRVYVLDKSFRIRSVHGPYTCQ